MVRRDAHSGLVYVDSNTAQRRNATDGELAMMQYWAEGQYLDAVKKPTLPFISWPYTRALIWGCCYSDTDVLIRLAHPQLVDDRDVLSYAPPPTEMMVSVNYPNFGNARVVGYAAVMASTSPILYFVVQKLQPFGAVARDPYSAGFFYRVPGAWCQRLPAAVVEVRADLNQALVWKITNPTRGKLDEVSLDDLRDPSEREDAAELRVAAAYLQQDWPRYTMAILGRLAQNYLPTDKDLRRWYGQGENTTTTTETAAAPPPQQQQQQQQQSSTTVVKLTGEYLSMEGDSPPRCSFQL